VPRSAHHGGGRGPRGGDRRVHRGRIHDVPEPAVGEDVAEVGVTADREGDRSADVGVGAGRRRHARARERKRQLSGA
jgi:hypothetical protein